MTTESAAASTQHDFRPAAVICRERGWDIGTHLIGDEGYGPSVIRITAVGEERILARRLSRGGKPCTGSSETSWVLWCRDWQPCDPPSGDETAAAAARGATS